MPIIPNCKPRDPGRRPSFRECVEKGVTVELPLRLSIGSVLGVELVLEEIDGPLLEVSDAAVGAGWILV